jgi:hypothetical protein
MDILYSYKNKVLAKTTGANIHSIRNCLNKLFFSLNEYKRATSSKMKGRALAECENNLALINEVTGVRARTRDFV